MSKEKPIYRHATEEERKLGAEYFEYKTGKLVTRQGFYLKPSDTPHINSPCAAMSKRDPVIDTRGDDESESEWFTRLGVK